MIAHLARHRQGHKAEDELRAQWFVLSLFGRKRGRRCRVMLGFVFTGAQWPLLTASFVAATLHELATVQRPLSVFTSKHEISQCFL